MNSVQGFSEDHRGLARIANEDDDVIDVMKIWNVLWQAKLYIAALVVIVCLVTAAVLVNLTPLYKATATLLIEKKTPQVLTFQQLYDPSASTSEYLQTQLALLKSRALAERVVKGLNLTTHPLFDPRQQPAPLVDVRGWWRNLRTDIDEPVVAPEEAAIAKGVTHRVMQSMSVQVLDKSQLLAVHIEIPDPVLAAEMANAFAEGFIASQLDAYMSQSLSSADWMNSRLTELRDTLRSAESRLQAYRESEGLVDVDGVATISADVLSMTGNRMIDARRQRAEAESQYRQVQAMSAGGLQRLASVPAVLGHPLIQQFKAEEAKARAKVEELSRRYGDKHPNMISARTELAAATASLHAQVQQVVAGIERNYQLAQANEDSLSQSFTDNKEQIQEISRKEFRLRELQREVDSNRVLYETFMTRLKETAATSDINAANARVVDRALPPGIPSKPNKPLILLIAAVAATATGIVLTFVREGLNNTFRRTEEIETKLNIPVLSIIPLVPKKTRHQLSHMFERNEDRRFCEAIRNMRTGLVLADPDTPRQIILVTSSVPNEGKSTVANNLAFAVAHIERVLLIEADLRSPTLARNFDFPVGAPGLADLIAGTARFENCIRTIGKVSMLPAGTIPTNPQELLSSPRLVKILRTLQNRYQRIIIDSPPTQVVSDSMLLATLSSAVLYVIRAESTPVSLVMKGVTQLQDKAPIVGAVLNQIDLNKARKYGYYYENYGYLAAAEKITHQPSRI